MKANKKLRLAVSIGCPRGIGPEISIRAALSLRGVDVIFVGDRAVVDKALARAGVDADRVPSVDAAGVQARRGGRLVHWNESSSLGRASFGSARAGECQRAWVLEALALVQRGAADALVTAPISKAAVVRGGFPNFVGHTELLGEVFPAAHPTMCFTDGAMAVTLVTTHLGLSAVPTAISRAGVIRAVGALVTLLRASSKAAAKIVVAGLNPHAGEEGQFGREELDVIAPAVRRAAKAAAKARVTVEGPVGAETAFRWLKAGDVNGVVAMYHDQATIACKLLGFGELVNVTLGLPLVRTSPDHGTAYDIAWKGKPDPAAMKRAMQMAASLLAAKTFR